MTTTSLYSDITVRTLSQKDFLPIIEILEQFPMEFSRHDVAIFREEMKDFLEGHSSQNIHFLSLEEQNELCGCISFHKDPESDTYGYIGWIVISKTKQNKGLGTQLLDASCERLRKEGCRYVCLKTVGTNYNRRVRQFYEKRGFNFVGTLPGYYLQPYGEKLAEEDCVMFFKKL